MSLKVSIKKKFASFQLDVSLEAKEGITCLLGASGSGKSVTLRCIAGLITPDAGHIELDGRVLYDSEKKINLSPQERKIGYVFQNYALFPHMTVMQNLFCGMLEEKNKKAKRQKAEQMIHFLQLEGLEKRYPGQLSGGQAQRVALARVLLSNPQYLMLDEAFSALDYHLKEKLIPEMKKILGSFPHGVLMVTHSRDEAYRLADDAAVIQKGHLLALKPVKALFADPESVEAALLTGCKNVVRAEKTGEQEVYIPDWGIHLATGKKVEDGVCAIGIRAHYFHPSSRRNHYPILWDSELEEPFEWIVQFRYKGQKEGTPSVWWRMPKEKRPTEFPMGLGVAPDNIMLLYDESECIS